MEAGSGGGRFLSVAQVAKRLGVAPRTVYRLIEREYLPAVRFPGCRIVKVRQEDFEAYLRAAGPRSDG